MLMHTKDKVSSSLKKDAVYKWCLGTNHKSSNVGETSGSLSEHVKEHSKESNHAAIYQHCTTKCHLLPNIDQFKVMGNFFFF